MIVFLIVFFLKYVECRDIFVHIEYGENHSFIFNYKLTTNQSYYLTFRLFEHEQINFGLVSPEIHSNQFQISNTYESSTNIFYYLFIICFHFVYDINQLDIECKDVRLSKTDLNKSPLPSYKPLFVPLMYALSILMLLPVIIQHRNRKREEFIKRRKQLRRMSLKIADTNPEILSNGSRERKNIPIKIDLLSYPSAKTMFDEIDDNDNVTFTLQNQESLMTADDCIAHLLDSTPWASPVNTPFDEQTEPILKKSENSLVHLYRLNPAFLESDV